MALARPMASRSASVVTFTKTQSSSAASGGATQARKVHSDAKSDKRLARQLETMKKWKTAKNDAKRESRKLAEKLRPLEDKLQIELDIHTKKRWATFDAKHASLIAAHKEATKRVRKASTQYGSSKRRIARKGGWGCSSYRDVLRSPYERDDEEDNM